MYAADKNTSCKNVLMQPRYDIHPYIAGAAAGFLPIKTRHLPRMSLRGHENLKVAIRHEFKLRFIYLFTLQDAFTLFMVLEVSLLGKIIWLQSVMGESLCFKIC